ncbi:MAG TPA: hypothetical protein VIS05_08110 [Ilumatobacter sp.]
MSPSSAGVPPPEPLARVVAPGRALDRVAPGATTGVGSLPHRNAREGARFALDAYDLPAIPNLPRRSPAESPLAQALVGVPGVSLGQYGTVAIDADRLDPHAAVDTRVDGDHFAGFRAFLELAVERGHDGPVKWQFIGPISVGVALRRAGADPDVAFATALRAVTAHIGTLADAVAAALPASPQLVMLDEPFVEGIMSRDFPIAPDEAIDLLSRAMAVLEPRATVGVHVGAGADIAMLLESGPQVLSLPVSTELVPLAGYLDRFLSNGGWIAWGAVATDGPIGAGSERSWRRLADVWGELVQRGCDLHGLRTRCLLTPERGLGEHHPALAERVCAALHDVARSLRSDAAAARFVLGA